MLEKIIDIAPYAVIVLYALTLRMKGRRAKVASAVAWGFVLILLVYALWQFWDVLHLSGRIGPDCFSSKMLGCPSLLHSP